MLAAIPLHQLMVLSLNKRTLKQVEKILRGFLWAGGAMVVAGSLPRQLGSGVSCAAPEGFGHSRPRPHFDQSSGALAMENAD